MSNLGKDQFVYLGYAYGNFKTEDGAKRDYANIFAFVPVQSNPELNYNAGGFKAVKLQMTSPEVAAGLEPGMIFEPSCDPKGRVKKVLCDGTRFKIG